MGIEELMQCLKPMTIIKELQEIDKKKRATQSNNGPSTYRDNSQRSKAKDM